MPTGSRSPARALLVVEDQDDVRLMLVTALRMEGYHVDEARTAHEGLECLKRRRYDLILTDYAMPGQTGTWMLHEAARAGYVHDTPSLVVTAHPELVRSDGSYTVVGKPIDLDGFLQQVTRLLNLPDDRGGGGGGEPAGSGAKVELILYVSAASPASMTAKSNMDRVLARFNQEEIKYVTCDLQQNPESAERDRVVFTPTLVRRRPAPRLWIIGDLRDGELVADLLRTAGVSERS